MPCKNVSIAMIMNEEPVCTDEDSVHCPNCGNEQPDMGINMACENCGHAPMPYCDEFGELIED